MNILENTYYTLKWSSNTVYFIYSDFYFEISIMSCITPPDQWNNDHPLPILDNAMWKRKKKRIGTTICEPGDSQSLWEIAHPRQLHCVFRIVWTTLSSRLPHFKCNVDHNNCKINTILWLRKVMCTNLTHTRHRFNVQNIEYSKANQVNQ